MNFGVAVGIFTEILAWFWAFLPGCFGQVQVDFGVAVGIFRAILE